MDQPEMTLAQCRAKRAGDFYLTWVKIFNDKETMERTMHLGGIIDMRKVIRSVRVETEGGYRYSPEKFRKFCARYFGTTIAEMNAYIISKNK